MKAVAIDFEVSAHWPENDAPAEEAAAEEAAAAEEVVGEEAWEGCAEEAWEVSAEEAGEAFAEEAAGWFASEDTSEGTADEVVPYAEAIRSLYGTPVQRVRPQSESMDDPAGTSSKLPPPPPCPPPTHLQRVHPRSAREQKKEAKLQEKHEARAKGAERPSKRNWARACANKSCGNDFHHDCENHMCRKCCRELFPDMQCLCRAAPRPPFKTRR